MKSKTVEKNIDDFNHFKSDYFRIIVIPTSGTKD